jgi:hypothetical protein
MVEVLFDVNADTTRAHGTQHAPCHTTRAHGPSDRYRRRYRRCSWHAACGMRHAACGVRRPDFGCFSILCIFLQPLLPLAPQCSAHRSRGCCLQPKWQQGSRWLSRFIESKTLGDVRGGMGGWVGLQKLITDLYMRNEYKGGV